MKLIIAGGRQFNNEKLMLEALNDLVHDLEDNDLEIVSGMAKGADMLGYSIAKVNNISIKEFPANWKDMSEPCVVGHNIYGTYNKLAGMKRNHTMGNYATHLIAFWDGKSSGTNDMIKYMESLNKPVKIVRY